MGRMSSTSAEIVVSTQGFYLELHSGSSDMSKTELNEDQRSILKALHKLAEPSGCKAIGEASDLNWRSVMGKMRGLSSMGLVESPEKGKYVISEKGKEAIS